MRAIAAGISQHRAGYIGCKVSLIIEDRADLVEYDLTGFGM